VSPVKKAATFAGEDLMATLKPVTIAQRAEAVLHADGRTEWESRRLHGLMHGDPIEQDGYDKLYGSGSEADLALCALIALGTRDAEQIEQVARTSGRLREKWDKNRHYLARTITRALDDSWAKYTKRHATPPPEDGADAEPKWKLLTDQKLMALPEPEWLVRHILAKGCLTLLYAMKDTYKSFVALSISTAIATGNPWLGDGAAWPTRRGVVVYVLAEGAGFYGRRVAAARQELGLSAQDTSLLRFVTVPVNLYAEGEVPEFISYVKTQLASDEYPVLFVFDTFARSIIGADENSNSDYSTAVEHAQGLQLGFQAAVLLVHHTGKDGLTARGGYALECASDVVLQLVRGDRESDVKLVFEHVKDTAKLGAVGLTLHEAYGSLVVRRNAADPSPVVTTGDKQTKARAIMLSANRQAMVDWIAKASAPVTAKEVAFGLQLKAKWAGEELAVLAEGNRAPLVASGEGKKGSPFRYSVRDPAVAGAGTGT